MPYEDEILKELEEGKTYPESVIFNFLYHRNDHVIVISDSCNHFQSMSRREFTVLKVIKGYVHECDNENIYNIPNSKSTIYYLN
nr:MAG TPA: hypothetical protein [Caudoviricetes sp.]